MFHPEFRFPEHLKTSSKNHRDEYFIKKFTLQHDMFLKCEKEVFKRLFKYNQFQIINVIGPTGIGKSQLAFRILDYCFNNAKKSGMKSGCPAIYLEVPSIKDQRINWKKFYASMLDQIDDSYFDISLHRHVRGNRITGRYLGEKDLENLFLQVIKDLNTSVIVIDEIQHLFKVGIKAAEGVLDALKSLSNLSKCQVVIMGTYQSIGAMNWDAQLERRTYDVHFHRYRWDKPGERDSFFNAVYGILAHLPYRISPEILTPDFLTEAYIACSGCLGVWKSNLDRCLIDIDVDDILTVSIIKAHRESSRKIERKITECKEGEKYFESSFNQNALAGKLGISFPDKSDVKSKKRGSRVGERKPQKDMVGGNNA